jgi:cytochrome c oxidase cbb3-type subunit 1
MQGFMWMDAAEWLNSVAPVTPFWFVRTLSGISMDLGMSLLVFNLMMTALRRPAPAEELPEAMVPGGAAARGAAQ